MFFKLSVLLTVFYITSGYVVEQVEEPTDYSKHQVIRILPNKLDQFDDLENIRSKFDLDFWNPPMKDMRPVLTIIGPEQTEALKALNSSNIKYEVQWSNYQKIVDEERNDYQRSLTRLRMEGKAINYETAYNQYADILSELISIGSSNTKATYESLGNSFQGRAIPSLTITNPGGGSKRAVFLECGIHAREWVSPSFCLYYANQLLTNSAYNDVLDKFKFVIVPVVNVDGYVYTWSTSRLWRKTRTLTSGCYGADPNRNWAAGWGTVGASNSPCSDTYYGSAAFSEPCAARMRDRILKENNNCAAYIAVHSYSQLWMWPFGYKTATASNAANLRTLSTNAVAAIKAVNNLNFAIGSITTAIYPASGSSIDWAYENANCQIAFALELRDLGQYGFQLPATQIRPAVLETTAGVNSVVRAIN